MKHNTIEAFRSNSKDVAIKGFSSTQEVDKVVDPRKVVKLENYQLYQHYKGY